MKSMKNREEYSQEVSDYLDIKKDNLAFITGKLVDKKSGEIIHANSIPFDITLVKTVYNDEQKNSILKSCIVFWLKNKSKKIPTFSHDQDYELSTWSYALFSYYDELCNTCVSPKDDEVEEKEIKVFNNAFDKIILPSGYRDRIIESLALIKDGKRIFDDWGLGDKIKRGKGVNLLFSGASGTGKTYCGEIIGEYLNAKVDIISSADFESKWVGESEQNISSIFKRIQGASSVLVIDEADSFLSERSSSNQEHHNKLTNQLLIELERHNGICVMTTNRPVVLDHALQRRVDLVLDFPFPTKEARLDILKYMIPEKMPVVDIDYNKLAEYKLSGGLIKNVILSAAKKAVTRQMNTVPMSLFVEAAEEELKEVNTLKGNK